MMLHRKKLPKDNNNLLLLQLYEDFVTVIVSMQYYLALFT